MTTSPGFDFKKFLEKRLELTTESFATAQPLTSPKDDSHPFGLSYDEVDVRFLERFVDCAYHPPVDTLEASSSPPTYAQLEAEVEALRQANIDLASTVDLHQVQYDDFICEIQSLRADNRILTIAAAHPPCTASMIQSTNSILRDKIQMLKKDNATLLKETLGIFGCMADKESVGRRLKLRDLDDEFVARVWKNEIWVEEWTERRGKEVKKIENLRLFHPHIYRGYVSGAYGIEVDDTESDSSE